MRLEEVKGKLKTEAEKREAVETERNALKRVIASRQEAGNCMCVPGRRSGPGGREPVAEGIVSAGSRKIEQVGTERPTREG